MPTIEIDGEHYHAREVWKGDEPTEELELILDENDQPIPASICLCYAREPSECCCGAWDDVDVNQWYSDDDWGWD